jgi:hypothetical protein
MRFGVPGTPNPTRGLPSGPTSCRAVLWPVVGLADLLTDRSVSRPEVVVIAESGTAQDVSKAGHGDGLGIAAPRSVQSSKAPSAVVAFHGRPGYGFAESRFGGRVRRPPCRRALFPAIAQTKRKRKAAFGFAVTLTGGAGFEPATSTCEDGTQDTPMHQKARKTAFFPHPTCSCLPRFPESSSGSVHDSGQEPVKLSTPKHRSACKMFRLRKQRTLDMLSLTGNPY